jgi:hypothetical protein
MATYLLTGAMWSVFFFMEAEGAARCIGLETSLGTDRPTEARIGQMADTEASDGPTTSAWNI